MLYLLDVDGVLAFFTKHVLETVGSDLTPDDVHQWDIFGLLGAKGKQLTRKELLDADWWVALPVIPGAKEGVSQIASAGHEIVYVTSPWWQCSRWEHARRKWLRKHFGVKARDVIITSRKELVRGDVLIDDKPEHIEAWHEANPEGHALLFDAPYNRDADVGQRFHWLDGSALPGV